MRKIAIFVEGLTERQFVTSLIKELVGRRGLQIDYAQQFRNKVTIRHVPSAGDIEFFVLVVDCCNDEQVVTQIRDQYSSLVSAGFTSIMGLCDVYPFPRAAIDTLKAKRNACLPTGGVTPTMHLAVMETEAWFIAEVSHFAKVVPTLTIQRIQNGGFDVTGRSPESWDHPAEILDNIYKLARCRYLDRKGKKTRRRIQRTVDALSLDNLYVAVQHNVPALRNFIADVEGALFCGIY